MQEARKVQLDAWAPPERLGDFFMEAFGSEGGVELELPAREKLEAPSFDE